MSASNSVTFTMSAAEQPAALRIASRFDNIRRVWASSPSSSLPVSGSRPVRAVTKMRSPVRIACEQVPMAGGPASVLILILLTMCLVLELDSLRGERNMIIDFYWTTGERRQIDQLDAPRKNDLQQHDVR